jgi:hypothetical protein
VNVADSSLRWLGLWSMRLRTFDPRSNAYSSSAVVEIHLLAISSVVA